MKCISFHIIALEVIDHARFSFLETLYSDHVKGAKGGDCDDERVQYHQYCTLRCYLLFLVSMFMFVDKSVTHVDVVYLKYFTNLTTSANIVIVHRREIH